LISWPSAGGLSTRDPPVEGGVGKLTWGEKGSLKRPSLEARPLRVAEFEIKKWELNVRSLRQSGDAPPKRGGRREGGQEGAEIRPS
jgi:hypothetical protein